MKTKKSFKLVLYLFLIFFVSLFLICYPTTFSFSLALSAFIANILYVLFAMLFWFISPIGILFFLGIKLSFEERASTIRRNFALLLQFLSFLSWSSLMFILLVVYIDSISYKIFNLGSGILDLAIKSGFGFMIFMFILVVAEKKMILSQKYDAKNNKNSGRSGGARKRRKTEKEESIKIAGIEIGGVKRKVKRKLKESLKEIVNEEIDRRL